MNIVVTDWNTVTSGDLSSDCFREYGTVTVYGMSSPEETAERIRDADIVLCNKTPMTESALSQAPRVRYIGLFATGYNNIDLVYTRAHRITVCNAAGYSTEAVAQHVFALLLEMTCRTAEYHRFVQDGKWIGSGVFSPFCYDQTELCGLTMGIIGYGKIGKSVARIAQAFGMRVLCSTRTPAEDQPGVSFVDFAHLLAGSDVISVHCPLTEKTAQLFNREAFSLCKPGAFFINTSRGGVVDEPALREALESGRIAAAALDVLAVEPMAPDCPLIGAPHLLLTPHIAWAPRKTRERLLNVVCDNLRAYLAGTPKNVVGS